MQNQFSELFSHPYLTTPFAIAAAINPLITASLPIVVQILGGIFLIMQIYYLFKNKGKK